MKHENDKPDNKSELVGEIVRISLRGSSWYANFQSHGKQVRKSLKTGSKKQAKRRALAIERDLVNGDFQRRTRAPTIASVVAEYISYGETEGRAATTLRKYRHCYRLVLALAAEMRMQRISDVDLRFVDAFRTMRVAAGAQPKTVHNDTVLIRQLINFAMRRKFLERDPLAGLRLPKVKRTPQPFWVREDVDRILALAEPPYLAPLVFLAETGTRFGEAQHLTWADVSLDGEKPHVRIQPKLGWKPKSGDMRVIPLSARAVAMLRGLPGGTRWVFTARLTNRHPEPDRQISERRLLAYLKRILKRLGLQGHLHTLRHSFISHALVQGTAEAIVRQWVGHVDREILQVYTHIADEASQAAMRRLSSRRTVRDSESSTGLESSTNPAQSPENKK